MKMSVKLKWLIFLFILIPVISFGQVHLPRLISDGMVLQRDANVNIWGWASPGEKISIRFAGSSYNTDTNIDGKWEVILRGLKAGGPYELQIDGSNSITIKDILVGDVWVCSGQSNMGSLRGFANNYQNEIAISENKFIRHFTVPQGFSLSERETDLRSGRWVSANPKDVLGFTAVRAYFKPLLTMWK